MIIGNKSNFLMGALGMAAMMDPALISATDVAGSKFISESTSISVRKSSLTAKQLKLRLRSKRAKQARKLNRV